MTKSQKAEYEERNCCCVNCCRGCFDWSECLVLFLLVAGLLLMLGVCGYYAFVDTDNHPERIFNNYVYDVSGNACGKNNLKVTVNGSVIDTSGQDKTNYPYLTFELRRTFEISFDQYFDLQDDNEVSDSNMTLREKTNYCLFGTIHDETTSAPNSNVTASSGNVVGGVTTTSPDTTAPPTTEVLAEWQLNATAAEVVALQLSAVTEAEIAALKKKYDAVEIKRRVSSDGSGGFTTALLTGGGQIVVLKKVLAKSSAELNYDLSSLGLRYAEQAAADPVSFVVTGGGSCRRCVAECPNNTQEFLHLCLPVTDILNYTANEFYSGDGNSDWVLTAIESVQLCWWEVLAMGAIGFGLCILMIVVISFLSCALFQWLFHLMCLCAGAGTVALWYFFTEAYLASGSPSSSSSSLYQLMNNGADAETSIAIKLLSSYNATPTNNYLWAAVILTIITVVMVLVSASLRRRESRLTLLLFSATARARRSFLIIGSVYCQFLLPFIALVVFLFLWVVGLLILGSSGTAVQNPGTGFVSYERWRVWDGVHFFCLVWAVAFILAWHRFLVAKVVSFGHFRRKFQLYVEKYPPHYGEDEIRALFSQHGVEAREINVHRHTLKEKGYALVETKWKEEVEKVITEINSNKSSTIEVSTWERSDDQFCSYGICCNLCKVNEGGRHCKIDPNNCLAILAALACGSLISVALCVPKLLCRYFTCKTAAIGLDDEIGAAEDWVQTANQEAGMSFASCCCCCCDEGEEKEKEDDDGFHCWKAVKLFCLYGSCYGCCGVESGSCCCCKLIQECVSMKEDTVAYNHIAIKMGAPSRPSSSSSSSSSGSVKGHVKGYCKASREADRRIEGALSDVVDVSGFLLNMARVVVVLTTMVAGAAVILRCGRPGVEKVAYLWVPIGAGGALAFVISEFLFGMFQAAMFTLARCIYTYPEHFRQRKFFAKELLAKFEAMHLAEERASSIQKGEIPNSAADTEDDSSREGTTNDLNDVITPTLSASTGTGGSNNLIQVTPFRESRDRPASSWPAGSVQHIDRSSLMDSTLTWSAGAVPYYHRNGR